MPPKKITARKTSDAADPSINSGQAPSINSPVPAALAQVRAEVEAQLRQYTDLYDFAPVGYFTLARDGAIHQVNLTGANLLGVERSKLIKRRFGVFVSVEARPAFSAFLEKVFSTSGSKETCEVVLQKAGSAPLWAHIEATRIEDGQREACRAVVVDITERKRAEEALRESDELLSLFMKHSPIYTFIKQATPTESRVLKASENYQDMIGIPGSEMVGKTMEQLFPAEFAAKFTADDWAVVSSGKVLKLDEDLNGRNYTTIKFPIIQGGKKLLAGYTIDITERKRAEEALHESEEHFRIALENSPIVVFNQDQELRYTWIHNLHPGFNPQEILGKTDAELLPADDAARLAEIKRRVLETGVTAREEVRTTIGVQVFFYDLTVEPLRDLSGNIIGVTCASIDITERKRAEEALRGSEERYRTLFETAPVIIYAISTDGRFTALNPAFEKVTGWSRDEWLSHPFTEIIHPDDLAFAAQKFQRVLQGAGGGTYYEIRFLSKAGAFQTMEIVGVQQVMDGQVVGTCGFARDITERKQAEDERRKITERLSLACRAGGIGIWELDIVNNNLIWDDQMFNLYGITPDKFSGTYEAWRAGVHPEDLQKSEEELQMAMRGEKDFDTEFRVVWPDGTIHNIRALARVLIDASGQAINLIGTNYDITERVRAEQALRESESSLQAVLQSTADGILAVGGENELLYTNEHFAEMWRIPPEIIARKDDATLLQYVVDQMIDPQDFLQKVQELYKSDKESFDKLYFKDGRVFERLSRPLMREAQPRGRVWSFRDITERNCAEEELKKSEERFKLIFEYAPDAFYLSDLKGNFIASNKAAEKITGFEREELIGGSFLKLNLLSLDQLPKAATLLAHNARGKPTGPDEFILKRKAGDKVPVEITTHPVKFEKRTVVLGIARDISERKQADETLRQSEAKYRSIFDNTAEGIFQSTPEGKFLMANPAMARILGFSSPEELISERTDIARQSYVHPEQREEFKRLMEQQNKVSGFEYEVPRKDGSVAWVSETAQAVWDATGRIVRYEGIFIDITERKQAEQALARQTEELRQRNEELSRLYRASGSLISGASLNLQELAQKTIEVVQQELGQANCSLLSVQKDSNELVRLVASGPYADRVKYQNLALDGPGLVPLAIRTNKVVNVGDVHSAPDYVPGWEAAQSELAIPLMVGSDVIGAIDVQSSQPNAFSPDDERLMTVFAERAALALEHSRLNTQIEARLQQLTALRTVDMAISASFDINLTLGVLLDQLTGQLGVHAADILIFNAAAQTFKFSCERGFRTQMLQRTQLKFGAGYAWRAIRERRVIVVPDIQVEPDGLQRSPDLSGEQFVAYLGMPLIAKGQIKGILEVFHREPFVLEKELVGFLEMLAGQAAIAIDNAELFDHLQRSNADLTMAYDSTLEGWASALELRDKGTEGHTRRVTELTIQLARALGVKENDTVHIYRGALLHDIGKVGVPDSIVLKPGPLTEDEWVIMRKHPQYSYEMLSPIAYLRLALDIPYCHHEKWDGTGYPRGLKGEQIPLAARIFAVVDVWDALISDRPYRKAWPKAKARQYIQEQAGLYFDPQVVRAFLDESFKKG